MMKIEICPECFDRLVANMQYEVDVGKESDKLKSIAIDPGKRPDFLDPVDQKICPDRSLPLTLTVNLEGPGGIQFVRGGG